MSDNVWALYFTYGVICGFGTGIIYVGIIGLMVRWFPDRRGLATGLAAAGYGFGAIFTSFPIDSMIKSSGYAHTLVVWGIIQGMIGDHRGAVAAHAAGELSGARGASPAAAVAARRRKRSFTPREMLQSPVFWLLFIMMSMMSTSGLMVVSNVGPFAKEYGVADVLVLGHGGAAAVADAVAPHQRPDPAVLRLGVRPHRPRGHDGARLFAGMRVAILVLFAFIDQPALFVVLTGLVFFGWGEIFSLFPSTLTDTFGPKFAATNYGFLYIAQGVGSILGGPAAAFLKQSTGSWTAVFIVVAVLDAVTALLAITVLRAMRQRALGGGLNGHLAAASPPV